VTDSFYITTPIYYVNDVPHIGHAYTTIAADAAARFHRASGVPTWFLTGTDEHGQKIARAAEAGGKDPQTWCDEIVPAWTELWDRLAVSNDDFIRTTEPRHTEAVQRFWQKLYDQGDVYSDSYEGPYCVACEAFYQPSEVPDGVCPTHGRPVEIVKEENWFFRLSKYSDWLLNEYYARDPSPVQPASRLNEVRSFVEAGLQDTSISRSSFDWGIPLPWDPGQVTYVWIEALLNYITALGWPDGERFASYWPGVNLVGKDILRFHAVTWPAMLHAAGIEPPKAIFAHGWLLVGGEKMSKTKLTGIHPDQLIEAFGVDATRYYFLRDIAFGQDGNFSWEAIEARYSSELANGLGNLASRVCALIVARCDGEVPDPSQATGDAERGLQATAEAQAKVYLEAMPRLAFHEALEAVDKIVRAANGYLVETEPWKLKEASDQPRVDAILYACAEALRIVASLLWPVMPTVAARLHEEIGAGDIASAKLPDAAAWGGLQVGEKVTKGDALFPRLEPSK
jgi:methionyl-tRNA synthetase